jgi:ribosomal protein L11 methyltransferase
MLADVMYLELCLEITDNALKEQIIAELTELEFDGFLEEGLLLKAYKEIPNRSDGYQNPLLNEWLSKYNKKSSLSILKNENWNALWERNFEPVYIENFTAIRANFHPSVSGFAHELIITPKMSFGTGHHATTYSVIQLMRQINFNNKAVYDFGTGTGVLAILAEKLGASKVVATDNDPWCINNATENVAVNNCTKVQIELVTEVAKHAFYDIIIANINKHIIEANQAALFEQLNINGSLLLSGLLISDEDDIKKIFISKGLIHNTTITKDGWIAIHLVKTKLAIG